MPKMDLDRWMDRLFKDRYVHPDTRREVRSALKIAGFKDGVGRDKHRLATRVADRVVTRESSQVEAEARVAAVVAADGACPRCGSAMSSVRLAQGSDARYCSNPKCRVVAHVG